MIRNRVAVSILTIGLACAWQSVWAQAADPISVLKSDAPLTEKMDACRKLSVNGTKDAVPVLAALLNDEKLGHMARYALEPMPFPEAGKALRDALGTTRGLQRVGVISSIGVRKDEQAVPELIKLLPGDSEVARAAARALGVIGAPDGEKALEDALTQTNALQGKLDAVCDGLLACAENLAHKDKRDQAAKIYDLVLQTPKVTSQIQTAALRGAVLSRDTEQGTPLLVERLKGDNVEAFASALLIARELKGNRSVTTALATQLASTSALRKVQILDVFGSTDGDVAGAAALALAKDGEPDVRVAALKALARMRYTPMLSLASQLAWSEEGPVGEAARNALAYFPGNEGDTALEALLHSDQAKARKVAVDLIGQGGLDNPVALLLKVVDTDTDETVCVAALDGLHEYAGVAEMPVLVNKVVKARSAAELRAAESTLIALCEREKRTPGGIAVQKAVFGDLPDGPSTDVLAAVSRSVAAGASSIDATTANFGDPAPGKVKQLRVEYTENGAPVSATVNENETLKFSIATAPPAVVDAFAGALGQAQGDSKLAMLRLLGVAGGPKAFDLVKAAAASDGPAKDVALRTLCNWPSANALPTVLELAKSSNDDAIKDLALRGAVRLLTQSTAPSSEILATYTSLLSQAATPDKKKIILAGLAQAPYMGAFELALAQYGDAEIKAEAVQAATAIAKYLGKAANEDKNFFNGKDLTGWQGNMKFWRFEDGAIVSNPAEPVTKNEFLWSNVPAGDFYLALDVKLDPNTGNGGVQFRSQKIDERGQALGYQGDMGKDVWGRLYHEHGRGKLDWTDEAEKAVKPGDWNHYEILAVGPAIWIAINGKLGAAYLETNPGERSGAVAVQLHAGPPETVYYRFQRLVHNPKVAMDKIGAKDLLAALRPGGK